MKAQGLKEEFSRDYKKDSRDDLPAPINSPQKDDDGQKEFFADEYKREGAFLLGHRVEGKSDNDAELKTSVIQDDKDD